MVFRPYLRTKELGTGRLIDYANLAQTAFNAEFPKTFGVPVLHYQSMEAAVKAVLDAAGVIYVD